jgi:hypothetical protein
MNNESKRRSQSFRFPTSAGSWLDDPLILPFVRLVKGTERVIGYCTKGIAVFISKTVLKALV